MTAYGRSSKESSIGRLTVEIQSINRKHLEVNVILPQELIRFDTEIKKWVSQAVGRGQITVRISVVFNQNSPVVVSANIPLALQIQKAARQIASSLEVSPNELTLSLLSRQPGILLLDEQMEDEELYRDALKDVFHLALQSFLNMKAQEGRAIFIDISQKLAKLHEEMKQIAHYAPEATKRYRQKLTERLKELSTEGLETQERILREIGIFAERVDISEEVVLFEAHLKQFSEIISIPHESIAKTLEFLIQEMNREINTIGSKSSDLEVSRRVVEIKGVLERIREIIQNVE